jgi:hypothetical protein
MNCGTCRHFKEVASINLDPSVASGACRRYPPTAFVVPSRQPPGFSVISDSPPVAT